MSRLKSLTRNQLAAFLPNPEAIRAFEKMQQDVNDTLPDSISSQSRREVYPWPIPQQEELQAAYQQPAEYKQDRNIVSISSNYSACDGDFITATLGAVITLPSSPDTDSIITIRNGDGSYIGVSGNSRTVNGVQTLYTKQKNTVLNVMYLVVSNEWVIA